MTTQLEIERKFLVKFPKSWSDLAELFDCLIDIKRIEQLYCQPETKDEQAYRVRKTVEGLTGDLDTKYHFNHKKFIEKSVNKETEKEIDKKEYQKHLKNPADGKTMVYKTRFVFKYKDQIFELDVFKEKLKGLAILEIELEDKNQKIEFPPWLPIIKEVSGDKQWNNFELADKKRQEEFKIKK